MPLPTNKSINFFFKYVNKLIPVKGFKNMTLLDVAHKQDINLEGACEGSLACSTCHVILNKKLYESLVQPSDREMDLLDQAFGVRSTSRLGCQVRVNDKFKDQIIEIPKCSRNMAVDGYVFKPH